MEATIHQLVDEVLQGHMQKARKRRKVADRLKRTTDAERQGNYPAPAEVLPDAGRWLTAARRPPMMYILVKHLLEIRFTWFATHLLHFKEPSSEPYIFK